MNRDEEILIIRNKQKQSLKQKSPRDNIVGGLLDSLLAFLLVIAICTAYHIVIAYFS